jgi:hypothetical protein
MEIFKIPNTPEFVEGLINLRGKVYTEMKPTGGDRATLPGKICPFMSHRGGDVEIVFCYREDCAAWKTHASRGYRAEAGPGGYCVRIWGPG